MPNVDTNLGASKFGPDHLGPGHLGSSYTDPGHIGGHPSTKAIADHLHAHNPGSHNPGTCHVRANHIFTDHLRAHCGPFNT